MEKKGYIENPLVIDIKDGKASLVKFSSDLDEFDLNKGVFFDDEYPAHFGFFIKTDSLTRSFKTRTQIKGIGIENNKLLVYENDEETPWIFALDGSLLFGPVKTDEMEYIISDEVRKRVKKDVMEYIISDEVRKKESKDVTVVIKEYFPDSYIEYNNKKYNIINGIVFDGTIYGFKVKVDIPGREETTEYATTAPLYGIQALDFDILVFEQDKSISWKFNDSGVLLREADFNANLRSEQKLIVKDMVKL